MKNAQILRQNVNNGEAIFLSTRDLTLFESHLYCNVHVFGADLFPETIEYSFVFHRNFSFVKQINDFSQLMLVIFKKNIISIIFWHFINSLQRYSAMDRMRNRYILRTHAECDDFIVLHLVGTCDKIILNKN